MSATLALWSVATGTVAAANFLAARDAWRARRPIWTALLSTLGLSVVVLA